MRLTGTFITNVPPFSPDGHNHKTLLLQLVNEYTINMASLVHSLLTNPGIPLQDRQDALNRALSDPGLPSQNPTSSFWLRDPHPSLAKAQSDTLPVEADVVIIGSGVTGTSIAKTLLESRKPRSGNNGPGQEQTSRPAVVMLEARDICSGATGRNGGHILETAEEFAELEQVHGIEAARKILRFRLAHLRELLAVAEKYDLTESAQARKVQFLSVYFEKKGWSDARARFQRLKQGLPEETQEWRLYERDEIPKVRCHIIICVYLLIRARSFLFPTLKESSLDRQVQFGHINSSQGFWIN